LCLGPLFWFCILSSSSISALMSVPLGFLVQYHLFLVSEAHVPCVMPLLHSRSSPCQLRPIPFVVRNFPGSKIPWIHFSCSMSLLHDGTPSCRWQPTSSGIHNLLGSVGSLCHSAASFRPLCRFFHPLTSFTMASPHISARSSNQSTQLGYLSHLEPCYHSRSRHTTTPSSVRRLSGKICFSCFGIIRSISSVQWWFLSWWLSGASSHV
jgi:hypothetical protein